MIIRTQRSLAINHCYSDHSEATDAVWRNQWFHAGDEIQQDEESYFYFVDRVKDAIRQRGENASSVEAEAKVIAKPDVQDAGAAGVPSQYNESEVLIAVAPRPAAKIEPVVLIEFLAARMSRFMIPGYVRILSELPNTSTANVQKQLFAPGRLNRRHLGSRSRGNPHKPRTSVTDRESSATSPSRVLSADGYICTLRSKDSL